MTTMAIITRSILVGQAATLAVLLVATGADAYAVRPPGSGLNALSTTVLGTQRTPTNAGPVGSRVTVGVMGTSLTPPGKIPIQTPLGGTISINGTQTLLHNTPFGTSVGIPVPVSPILTPMPSYNGTGLSTGVFRTNTSAYRGIPGPLMTAPPYSLGNPANQPAPLPTQLPALLTAKPLEPVPSDTEGQKMLKMRYNAELRLLQESFRRYKVDPTTSASNVIAAARWLLAADLALGHDKVTAHEQYLDVIKYIERETEIRFKARLVGQDQLEAAQQALRDAEVELLKSKAGRAAPGKPEFPRPLSR
jgi:hypothetical protein